MSNDFIILKDNKKISLSKGYLVGSLQYEKIFYNVDHKQKRIYNLDQILKLSKKYQSLIQDKQNYYVVIYATKKGYILNICKLYLSIKQAKKQGIKNKQLFIYDSEHHKPIALYKNTYIVYKYNAINNDYTYVMEYYNYKDILTKYNISNIYNYVIDSIDDVPTHLLKNMFSIYIDKMPMYEL